MIRRTALIAGMLIAGMGSGAAALAADGATSTDYASLEDFCLKTQADTPENCACGQATADELLTAEEQEMALELMGQQARPQFESIEAHDEFMARLSKVTEGCRR